MAKEEEAGYKKKVEGHRIFPLRSVCPRPVRREVARRGSGRCGQPAARATLAPWDSAQTRTRGVPGVVSARGLPVPSTCDLVRARAQVRASVRPWALASALPCVRATARTRARARAAGRRHPAAAFRCFIPSHPQHSVHPHQYSVFTKHPQHRAPSRPYRAPPPPHFVSRPVYPGAAPSASRARSRPSPRLRAASHRVDVARNRATSTCDRRCRTQPAVHPIARASGRRNGRPIIIIL